MSGPAVNDIYLPAGHFHFGGGNVRVHTLLGTCVAITMWHPARRIGGICHYLLPVRRAPSDADSGPCGLYADEAMNLFTQALNASDTHPHEFIVKIAGGGNMFPAQMAGSACPNGACSTARRSACQSVGCRNIGIAHTLLGAGGFAIAAEHVGGDGSRQVIFELATGDVWIKRGAPMTSVPRVAA